MTEVRVREEMRIYSEKSYGGSRMQVRSKLDVSFVPMLTILYCLGQKSKGAE